MSRALAWVGVGLFCAAWWSLFYSLTAFGVLLAASMVCVVASELVWHVQFSRAYLRHPSNVVPLRPDDCDEAYQTTVYGGRK